MAGRPKTLSQRDWPATWRWPPTFPARPFQCLALYAIYSEPSQKDLVSFGFFFFAGEGGRESPLTCTIREAQYPVRDPTSEDQSVAALSDAIFFHAGWMREFLAEEIKIPKV